MNAIPDIEDIFPFEYISGGYFRKKGVKKGEKAEILHGDQAIKYVYDAMINMFINQLDQVLEK
jgi:hypothetical protein